MSKPGVENETSDAISEENSNKRKRRAVAEPQEELEIDVNLPEPPSKKARRKEKQGKIKRTTVTDDGAEDATAAKVTDAKVAQTAPKISEYGIWIGNLSFSATADKVREFFEVKGDIPSGAIVRLNMPVPPSQKKEKPSNGPPEINKPGIPQNKGFAYVDFATKELQDKALALSETLLIGRRVLIKDAKSFSGRPAVTKTGDDTSTKLSGKEPSKKVFVGNLGFDVTKQDLTEILGKAGDIADCFLATFEDTGKCKGFGWVRFKELEAAQAAVRGYVYDAIDNSNDEEQKEDGDYASSKKPFNLRKKTWVNMLNGRALRCEFAEDAQTRYKKRFGRDRPPTGDAGLITGEGNVAADVSDGHTSVKEHINPRKRYRSGDKEQRRDDRRKRHDARTIAPGRALAHTPRASAAIVEGAGEKLKFD